MTALFAFAGHGSAHVLADAAYVGFRDGRIRQIGTKIFSAAADGTAVVAISGPLHLNELVCGLVRDRGFVSFDDVVDRLDADIAEIEKDIGPGFWSLKMAGWSKTIGRPAVYKMHGGNWTGEPAPAPKLVATHGLSISGPQAELPIPASVKQFNQRHRLGCAPPFLAELHARPFFEATRAWPSPLNGRHVVGGYLEEARITAAGTIRRIVCRWSEDQIGEHIDPHHRQVRVA